MAPLPAPSLAPSLVRRLRRRLAAALLGAAASLLLLPALLLPAALARPLDEVKASGFLRVTVYADFFPFSHGQGARLAGVDVDLGRQLAERLGVRADFFVIGADESVDDDLRNGVWRGPLTGGGVGDVMLHVPYDRALDARTERAVLFAPYYREALAIARRTATPSLAALAGETVAVEIDSLPDLYLSAAFGGRLRETLRRHQSFTDAAEAWRTGRADALMGTRAQVEAETAGHAAVLSQPPTPGLVMPEWPLGMAVREDSRDLGYALAGLIEEMIADGSLAALFATHGLSYHPPH